MAPVQTLAASFLAVASSLQTDDQASTDRDRSLFIGPFYQLNPGGCGMGGCEAGHYEPQFREAYCIARHDADQEDFTTVFNTAVHRCAQDEPYGPGARYECYNGELAYDSEFFTGYYTREEFRDGASFNEHLINVADAFANAQGVSRSTGFFALGTEDDLQTIHENAVHNNMTTFVKDTRSFKKRQFKGDDYFAIDFFVDVPQQNLASFTDAWRGARNAAHAEDGILAFAMGIHENEDGSYKAVCQETYASAAAYLDWLPKAGPHVSAILDAGSVSNHPNPFTMTGKADTHAALKDTCQGLPFPCFQYFFDTCGNTADTLV